MVTHANENRSAASWDLEQQGHTGRQGTMRDTFVTVIASVVLVSAVHSAVLTSDSIRLELDAAGKVVSLKTPSSDTELARPGGAVAFVRIGEAITPVTSARAEENRLTLDFGSAGVKATVSWQAQGDLLLLALEEVHGDVDELTWFHLHNTPGAQVLCSRHVLRYDQASLALIAERPECHIRGNGGNAPYLMATTYPTVKLAPARVALMGAPREKLPDVIQAAEELFDIPLGIKAKRSDAARGSYLMISGVTEGNIDRVTEWAAAGGFGSILMIHGTWGHYGHRYAVPEQTFPGGIEALRAAVDKMHEVGVLAGAHMFSSKVPKNADCNQGKAERRLYQDKFLVLAKALTAGSDRIVTTEPPSGWPVITGTRDIRIGDELMVYTDLHLEAPFGFTGVKRGTCGTVPQAHQANVEVAHVKTDESRGIFIIDQTTEMIEQHAQDIANTYNAAGFDWIYFDGAEDVHDPRWYTTSNAKLEVIKRLERKPFLVQAAAGSPFSWHLNTRVGQRDYFWQSEDPKDEVDDAIAGSVPRAEREMMVADLGWFPLKPSTEHVRGTQLDDVEYLAAKAMACNMTYSILTNVEKMRSIIGLDAMLYVMGRYEHHKFAGTFGPETRGKVLTPHEDYMLVELPGKPPRIVRARELPYCARTGHLVRAMRGDPVDGVRVVSLTPVSRKTTIEFSFDRRRVEFVDYKGDPWPVEWLPGSRVRVPLTTRVLMRVTGGSANIRDELRRARATVLPPSIIAVDAAKPNRTEGSFTTASEVGVRAVGAIGEVVVPTVPMNTETGPKHWLEYDVDVPKEGRYYLWIRARYSDTNSNSFFLRDPGQVDAPIRLGNTIGNYDYFFWDGGVPLDLKAGKATLRIMGREARPNQSPMLDCLVLVHDDPAYRPTDNEAAAAMR